MQQLHKVSDAITFYKALRRTGRCDDTQALTWVYRAYNGDLERYERFLTVARLLRVL